MWGCVGEWGGGGGVLGGGLGGGGGWGYVLLSFKDPNRGELGAGSKNKRPLSTPSRSQKKGVETKGPLRLT